MIVAEERFCDLHVHSTASDGTDPPEQLGALARAAGVHAIALTDHDTTAGLAKAAEGCEQADVAFVPGIEVSVDPGPLMINRDESEGDATSTNVVRRGTLHILGLFVEPSDVELAKISEQMKQARDSRNPEIIKQLQSLGIPIDYEEVESLAQREGTVTIGRPHIGQVLIEKGLVSNMTDAFKRYIGQGGEAFVRRDRLSPTDAIAAIHHAGGAAVLAHPVQLYYETDQQLEHIVSRLKEAGLDAIEVQHSDHSDEHVAQFQALALKFDLLMSGGSDYHGTRKTVNLGQCRVPFSRYQILRDRMECS